MKKPAVGHYIMVKLNVEEHAWFAHMLRSDTKGMEAEKIRPSHALAFLADIGVFEYSRAHKDWYWFNWRMPYQLVEYGMYAFLYVILEEDE